MSQSKLRKLLKASNGYSRLETVMEIFKPVVHGLKLVENSSITGQPGERVADSTNASLFLSVLMAVAFTLITRVDVAVFVVALQRQAKQPTYEHIRKLNTIVKWVKKNPGRLIYRRLKCQRILECHSDTGFRREEGIDLQGFGQLRPKVRV